MKLLRTPDDMPPAVPLEAYIQDAPAEPARTSTFQSAASFHGLEVPERHWLVDGLIPSKTVTILNGDGGTGKSLLAAQLASATALGNAWLGRPVAGGGAIYLSAEDDEDELHRRFADIAFSEGVTMAELHRLTYRSLAGEDALLAVQGGRSGLLHPSGLYDELDQRISDETPALVLLDTLADIFPGNENDRAQARHFVGMMRGLAIRHDCAVVMLAHPSLSGLNSGSGTSGSTAWNNSARSRLYLERITDKGYEADPDARRLSTKKVNYGRIGGEILMRWQGGVFVADKQETGLDRMATNAKGERVFLSLLRHTNEMGRRVNHAGGQTYAPKVFAALSDAEGMSKRALSQAMETLLSSGKIRISEDGPPSRRRQFLEVV